MSEKPSLIPGFVMRFFRPGWRRKTVRREPIVNDRAEHRIDRQPRLLRDLVERIVHWRRDAPVDLSHGAGTPALRALGQAVHAAIVLNTVPGESDLTACDSLLVFAGGELDAVEGLTARDSGLGISVLCGEEGQKPELLLLLLLVCHWTYFS